MLTQDQINDAARRLDEAERTGRQMRQLSLQYPGMTIDDAYAGPNRKRIVERWVAEVLP